MLVDSQRSGYSLESSLRQASNDQTARCQQAAWPFDDDLLRTYVARTMVRCAATLGRQSGADSGSQNPPLPHVARIRAHPLGARRRLASTSEQPPGKPPDATLTR